MMSSRSVRLLLALLASVALACERSNSEAKVPAATLPADAPEPHFIDRMPEEFKRVLSEPSGVRFLRITNPFDVSATDYAALKSSRLQISGYPVAEDVPGSREQARELGSVLQRKESYLEPGEQWMCIFEPHHVALFSRGKESVNVIICFKCGDIEMRRPDDFTQEWKKHGLSREGQTRIYRIVGGALPEQ